MGSDESCQVLALLKELSVLKEQDSDAASHSERAACRLRQQEISEEIKALAEEKKQKQKQKSD